MKPCIPGKQYRLHRIQSRKKTTTKEIIVKKREEYSGFAKAEQGRG